MKLPEVGDKIHFSFRITNMLCKGIIVGKYKNSYVIYSQRTKGIITTKRQAFKNKEVLLWQKVGQVTKCQLLALGL